MPLTSSNQLLLDKIIQMTLAAGSRIMEVYGRQNEIIWKADESPLTTADLRSHEYLTEQLMQLLPGVPVISEEGVGGENSSHGCKDEYWIIDPLDGTKEFLKQSGDFTVNVALVKDRTPILGVVHAPVRRLTYFGARNEAAWRTSGECAPVEIRTRRPDLHHLSVVASKDHAGPRVQQMLDKMTNTVLVSMGSSLKFCLVAEGSADLYPRFVPTMEWDTAAAQCIVETAGGAILTLDGSPLTYGKAAWRNPSIVTVGRSTLGWREWLP